VNRSSLTMILERTLEFLKTDGLFLLSDQACDSFVQEAEALLQKADKPGEALYVGILGGTGVGKSTLINALAGKKISDASDRRPFTDRAVLYRHKDTPRGLEKITPLIRDNDALHDCDTIKDLVLLDLPDFDSVDEDNRRTVIEILAFLDCVVWVVSPEKYADAVFYSFVGNTRINRENFTFVFNKADELVGEQQADQHGKLKELLGDFTFRLKHEAGVEQPRVFIVSAASEVDGKQREPVLESEFKRFKNFLMVRRDAKEVASVKTVNLMQETRHLLNELDTSIVPVEKKQLLSRVQEVETELGSDVPASSLQLIDEEHKLAKELVPFLMNEDASIRPVRLATKLLSLGRTNAAKRLDEDLGRIFLSAAAAVSKDRRAELEKAGARLDSEFLLAFPRTEVTASNEGPEELMNRAVDQASKLFAQKMKQRKESLAGRLAGWRRFGQRAVLSIPALILIVRLSGPATIEAWLDHPSLTGGLKILVGFLTSLFSSDGLTGLTVLLICELFLVFYLAARRIKRIEKYARGLAASAIKDLDGRFDAATHRLGEKRRETVQRIQEGIDHLNSLSATFNSRTLGSGLAS
jgi:GTP-binding protein EngB required for normal cell division